MITIVLCFDLNMLFGRIKPSPCRVIYVNKSPNKQLDQLCGQWIQRAKHYGELTETRIKTNPRNSAEVNVQVADEGLKILKTVKTDEYLILLDENGKELNSIEFAKLLSKLSEEKRKVAFCVGGPHGTSELVQTRADLTLKLSSFVFNHEIARLVILEQIYRGWTIIAGHPYHH